MTKARKTKTLLPRLLVGFGLGVTFLLSLVSPVFFLALAVAAAVVASWELANALRHGGWKVPRIPVAAAAIPIITFAYTEGPGGQWVALLISTLFLLVWRLVSLLIEREKRTIKQALRDLAATTFVLFYIPLSLSFAVLMIQTPDTGTQLIFSVVLTVVAIDTFGYVIGRFFGKTSFAPGVSPKKTWEGFLASVVGALLVGFSTSFFLLGATWWQALLFGLALLLSAVLGDLTESLIKRDLGIKDMGDLLPGHGGVMDRLDSLLPSAFIGYLFANVFF